MCYVPEMLQITIDTTPPVAGVVHDGPGPSDVDFQQSLSLKATWHNFLDRESGVVFYHYAFKDRCLTVDRMKIPPAEGGVSCLLFNMFYNNYIICIYVCKFYLKTMEIDDAKEIIIFFVCKFYMHFKIR